MVHPLSGTGPHYSSQPRWGASAWYFIPHLHRVAAVLLL
jgi:hypothetical protein